jgi:hypothetical protein
MAAVDDLDEILERWQLAVGELVKGNPEPVQKLWSHREDVSLANPWYEPHFPDNAHSQLLAFWACIASNSSGGTYPRLECNRFWL